MTVPILVAAEAQEEISAAHDWYESALPGLGARFIAALDATFARIADNPALFPRAFGFQRAVLRAFPYCIYFRTDLTAVVILGVFHGRRNPLRLRGRK